MSVKVGLVLLACLTVSVLAEKARYDNYQVHNIMPQNMDEVKLMQAFQIRSQDEFDFWTDSIRVNAPVLVLVAPHQRAKFNEFVTEHGLQATISIPNLQGVLDEQQEHFDKRSKATYDWTSYHNLDEIYAWLDELAAKHDNVKVVVGGTSYEKREIRGIEITNGENFPGVIIESGIHAREWIAPAATSWIINEALNSDSDSIWKQFNFLYFPSLNPDGFEYSINEVRSWRKTRQLYKDGFFTCYGADPNRNWDNHWMEGGSTSNPCSDLFAGSAPNSEIEVKSISEYYTSVHSKYDIYIAFHSFSQLLMFPWGWTADHAPHHDLWQRVGDLAAGDLEAVHGTQFQVGNIHDTVYLSSGSSAEWYYGQFNSTLTFAFECRDQGHYGFVLPPDQIIPAGEELQAAVARMLLEYQKLSIG